jgi:tripartite-type tricarboxylate transporter receptor subunit TctC
MAELTRRTVTALLAALLARPGFAQSLAQGRLLTIVVPFPPGGSTDAMARLLQPGLRERLGINVVVENKAGGAGSIGAAQVARSTPDGSTLLLTFDSHAVIPALLDNPIVDVENDLVPVLLAGTAPYVVAANASRPFRDFGDVIEAAKKAPGRISFASVGLGTIGHLAMTVLSQKAGVEITHVPYKGGGPAMGDVIGGHVDMIVGSAALIVPQLGNGSIRPLMQMGRKRLDALPDVATAIESGYADFDALAWWGMFLPRGTPQPVVQHMSETLAAALREDHVTRRLRESQQIDLLVEGPDQFKLFFERQVRTWGAVVREHGIKSD